MAEFYDSISADYSLRRLRLDCRHYRGDRPCAVGIQGVCPARCAKYAAMGQRILVIKLAALGDVIRTTALLPGLKQRWPESHITWVTCPGGARMLADNPLIDRLLTFDAETICRLEHERFDLCLSLDKEPAPAALAMRVNAIERKGIGLSRYGTPFPLNRECEEYFELGLDDHKKFHLNRKSYQQLLYEALGLRYQGQRYRLYPSPAQYEAADRFWVATGVLDHEIVIGFNTGAGDAFANKNWSEKQYIELGQRMTRQTTWRVALFGGPAERQRNLRIAAACPGLIDTGCEHDELGFAALLKRCNVLVTGDTMGMHVAIAHDVSCVAIFGPTCEQEIDFYGVGEKVQTPLSCSPCYLRHCDKSPNCMDAVDIERVFERVYSAVERIPTAYSRGDHTPTTGAALSVSPVRH